MIDFKKIDWEAVKKRKQEEKEKEQLYLSLHPECQVIDDFTKELCCDKAVEILEFKVKGQTKIFKSTICDWHSCRFLLLKDKDIHYMIEKGQIKGEWVED